MCDACVIAAVQEKMMSRRGFFGVAAAGASVIATASATLAAPATSGHSRVLDLTHELHEDFPTFLGQQQFFREPMFQYSKDKLNIYELRMSEHTGTHIDAPLHFSADGQSIAEIPVDKLVVPLCVIDLREKVASNDDVQLTPSDIKAWTATNGDIPENACVAMLTGWAAHLGTSKFRNADAAGKLHFPGFHPEAAELLLHETKAAGIAVDTLSLDYGMSTDFRIHTTWLPAGRWGIEAVANLDRLPAKGATLVVGAPKHRGGTGGPARLFALV